MKDIKNTKRIMEWEPVLSGAARARTCRKVREIAEILCDKDFRYFPADIMSGTMGISLFLYYYWLYTEEDSYYEKAARLTLVSLDKLKYNALTVNNPSECNLAFSSGMSGMGWGFNHLLANGLIEGETSNTLDDLSPWIYRRMILNAKDGVYDFMNGASGIALYCMGDKSRFAREYINVFISKVKSFLLSGRSFSRDYVLPVQLCELLFIMNKIKSRFGTDHDTDNVISLLRRGINEKMAGIFDGRENDLSFPTNDFIRSMFLSAYFNDGDDRVMNHMEMLGKKYINSYRGLSLNIGLNNGVSYFAHLYAKLYNSTGNIKFKSISSEIYNIILESALHVEPQTGYRIWYTSEKNVIGLNYGLLEGISGIGLSLLGAITNNQPTWDECLLLS